jgi:hypothetical protein
MSYIVEYSAAELSSDSTAILELSVERSLLYVPKSMAYHVHFPGNSELLSGFVEFKNPVQLRIPQNATAMCVTLVCRLQNFGWRRHSRCRFTLGKQKIQNLTLKDEQLGLGSPAYGSARLTMLSSLISNSDSTILVREWFAVTRKDLDVFEKSNINWYKNMQPIDASILFIHASTWSNGAGSIPGWCFGFPPNGAKRYSTDDLLGIFALAGNFLGQKDTSVNALTNEQFDEILALGLTLFGLSIGFQNDSTVQGTLVERFSSTARLDGVGDCEDKAKESALVFGDLLAFDDHNCALLTKLCARAKKFQFCICLTTVRRYSLGPLEAHAFGMLLPNSVFPQTMLTRVEIDTENQFPGNRMSYMCDGVYDCHPTKKKVRFSDFRPENLDNQLAPWNYRHIVSAFVYGKGEVYFTQSSNLNKYGVQADNLFPNVNNKVVVVDAHGPKSSLAERTAAAKRTLASNLPRTLRAFEKPEQTPLQRFKESVRDTPNRAEKIAINFNGFTLNT